MRRFQLHLLKEKKLSAGTVKIRMSALRFFYKKTLKRRDLNFDDLPFPKIPGNCLPCSVREEVDAPDRCGRRISCIAPS